MAEVVIVGCGRRDSGDDALGTLAAEILGGRAPVGVEVWLAETPGVELLDRIGSLPEGPARLLIFVDAAQSGRQEPGTWLRLDYRENPQALRGRGAAGTHALSIAEILALGETLGILPGDIWIYALFGQAFDLGAPISKACEGLAERVAEAVDEDVRAYLAGGRTG